MLSDSGILPDGYDPKKEVAFLEAAERSEEGMEALRKEIRPLLEKMISHYESVRPYVSRETLEKAAFKPLPSAVKGFLKSRRAGGAAYKFITYYMWWARRGIEYELGIEPEKDS